MQVSTTRILFFPVNGSGLGHMTRCLSYARALRDRNPQAESAFFSLSSAVEFLEAMGFNADYFVSPFWSCNSAADWNDELIVRFGLMLEQVQPDLVVFDGTWPFQGFLQALRAYGKPVKKVWSRRGLLKKERKAVPVDTAEFDLILQPGELGAMTEKALDARGVQTLTVPPVALFSAAEQLSREEARQELELDPDLRYALFSLGPGNLKDVSSLGKQLIDRVQAKGFSAVWTCPPISVHDAPLPDTVRPLAVYPLSRFLRAFDLLIGAGGYNTCCEVALTQIPSLLIPNTLLADDQEARARLVAEHAPCVVSACESEEEQREAVERLCALAGSSVAWRDCPLPMDGAQQAAEALLALVQA